MSCEIDLAADQDEELAEMTVEQHFAGFVKEAPPPAELTAAELRNARAAFFAGVASMLFTVVELETSGRSVQERAVIYDQRLDEIERFTGSTESQDNERIRLALEGARRGQH